MPKTKDAFALKDFDPSRILQRRFFTEFGFGADLTDREILQSLSYSPIDSQEIMEKKLSDLENIFRRVTEYQQHIKRHGQRLTEYISLIANRIAKDETANIDVLRANYRRAEKLSMKYCGCVTENSSVTAIFLGGIAINDVGGLCTEISKRYNKLDGEVQHVYRKVFADRLKFARQKTKMSQKEFAEKLGLSQNGYSPYENGQRNPSIPMLIRLSRLLNRSADWLLGQTAW